MLEIVTIENPEFKNCILVPSECGMAYRVKQKKDSSNNSQPETELFAGIGCECENIIEEIISCAFSAVDIYDD